MEGRLPDQLSFQGNIINNFEKCIQSFETYLIATEKDKKAYNVKIALLLSLIGGNGLQLFNTFKLDNKEKVLKQNLKNIVHRIRIEFWNVLYLIDHVKKVMNDLNILSNTLIKSCEYSYQEDFILTDRIMLGVTNLKLQKMLCSKDVTEKSAIEMYRGAE
ncbi:hypothetical protein PR048_005812 [Dryococelus australis]|uniref:Uncharacterized protein n=1 Tax=Dryococelus australis TaxID=614101 RepID=A0ABQ9I997_9NEOP|nr:hypothetical protein PR048_005812 [Dryococelus australis]